MKNPMMMDKLVDEEQDWEEVIVKDGILDPAANYTLFVELIREFLLYPHSINGLCNTRRLSIRISSS